MAEMKTYLVIFLVVLITLTLFNALRLWGNYLFSAGRVIEAIAFDPYNYLYHFAAGTTLLQSKQSDQAVTYLKKAIKLNPSYTDTLNNLAVALIIEKRYDEARKVLADLKRKDARDGYGKQNFKILEKMMEKAD